MASEFEFVNYKDFVESLSTTDNPTLADKQVISNLTNGPRAVPASESALTDTATEKDFISENYIRAKTANGWMKIPANMLPANKIIDRGSATVATINALAFRQNGWKYFVTDSGTLSAGSLAVSAGDSVAWDATGEKWYKVNLYAPRSELFIEYGHKLVIVGITTVVATGIVLEQNKCYKLRVTANSLPSFEGSKDVLYFYKTGGGHEVLATKTAQELYDGFEIEFTPGEEGNIQVRTYQAGFYVDVSAMVLVGNNFLFKEIEKKADSVLLYDVEEKTVTASVTTPFNSGIFLKVGKTYTLFAKSDVLITDDSRINVFYTEDNIPIANCTSGELYLGFSCEYTPSAETQLRVRANQAGVSLDVKVSSLKEFAREEEFNSFKEDVDNHMTSKTEKTLLVNGTVNYNTGIVLNGGEKYTLFLKSDELVDKTGTFSVCYVYPIDGSASSVICSATAQELNDGITFVYTPIKDVAWHVRTFQSNVHVNVRETHFVECADKRYVIALDGKTWACFGDSITAISNGNSLDVGWAAYVNKSIPLTGFYGRGVGGQRFAWGSAGGSVTFVSQEDGRYNSRNDGYNKDNYTGAVPEGCAAIRGCFCSWDRITHMFPANIKDAIDVVCIMGGTNDIIDATEATFVVDKITDTEWATSGDSYYGKFGGDFNIETFKGGIASCVMKFQAWMPNAIIVICTPLSGRGTTGEVSTDLNVAEYAKAQTIKEMAERTSCPCIDVFGTCGISPFNRTEYISDAVHPYLEAGKKMLARSFIMGLKNIEPNL